MQAPAVLVASLALAIGAAAGVTVLMQQKAEAAEVAETEASDLQARIADLEKEIEALRRANEVGQPVERQAIDPVSPEEIDAAVARWMAEHPIEAPAEKESDAPAANLDQTFLRLSDGVPDEEMQPSGRSSARPGRSMRWSRSSKPPPKPTRAIRIPRSSSGSPT